MSNKYCEGCTAHKFHMYKGEVMSEGCSVDLTPQISETSECPCVNCLVKMICGSICQEFKNYIYLYRFISKKEI